MHPDNHCVTLPVDNTYNPLAYADADWAANILHCRSVEGGAIFLAGVPIIYKYKLKPYFINIRRLQIFPLP